MKKRPFCKGIVPLLVAWLGLGILSPTVHALDQKAAAEKVVESFLHSKQSERETTQSEGSEVADLNGDKEPEIVLVWATLGATYWRYTLTVFSKNATGYASESLPLEGFAKLSSAKDGIIFVEQTVYAKSDPTCCPSVNKQAKYRWLGKAFAEVR